MRHQFWMVVVFFSAQVAGLSYRWSIFRDDHVDLCVPDLRCGGDQPSTMCLKKRDRRECKNFTKIEWTFDMRKTIVNAHNGLRNRIAVSKQPAANMNYLHWDKDLEELAEKWVLQCTINRDFCGYIYNTSFPIGQNIRFLYGVQKAGWEGRVIRDWFLEYDAEFSDKEITNFSDQDYTNYTQLIWAKTEFLGCAAARFGNGYFMVCNYYPKGNIFGQSMYQLGPSCEGCPIDRSSCSLTFEGLCGLDDMYSTGMPAWQPHLILFVGAVVVLLPIPN